MSGQCPEDQVLDFQQSDKAKEMFAKDFKGGASDQIKKLFTGTQLEDMTKVLNDIHGCDEQCLEEKNNKLLKDLWNKSNLDLELAEVKVIKATREYLTESANPTKSQLENPKWKDWRDKEIAAEWLEFSKDISNSAQTVNKTYRILYDTYNQENNMLKQVQNLYDMKSKKFSDIMKNIMEYEKLTNVDIRKNYYQFTDLEFYNNIKYYLKIVYYAIFVIYIFFGDFMIKKRYRDYRFYIAATIYLLLPFTIKYIIGFISYIYNQILEYFNLKPPVYAYSDIVQANNIDNIYTAPVSSSTQIKNQNNPNLDYYLNDFISSGTISQLTGTANSTKYTPPKPFQPDPYCEISYNRLSNNEISNYDINIYCPSGSQAIYQKPFMSNINKNVSQEELTQLQTSCSVLLGSVNTYPLSTFDIENQSLINSANFNPITCPSYIPQYI